MEALTSSPSRPTIIPEDIAGCIAQFVGDDVRLPGQQSRQKDLYAFCLVNRTFYTAGLSHLYRNISLGPSIQEEEVALRKDILICRTLARQPHLASHVRSLSLNLGWILGCQSPPSRPRVLGIRPSRPRGPDIPPSRRCAPAICRLYFRALYRLKNLNALTLNLIDALKRLLPNFLRCPAQLVSFTCLTRLDHDHRRPMQYLIDLLRQPAFNPIQQLSITFDSHHVWHISDQRFTPVLQWLNSSRSELSNLTSISCIMPTFFFVDVSEAVPGRPIHTFRCCRPPRRGDSSVWYRMLKNLSESSGPLFLLELQSDYVTSKDLSDIARYLPHLVKLFLYLVKPASFEALCKSTIQFSTHFSSLQQLVFRLTGSLSGTIDDWDPRRTWMMVSPKFVFTLAAGTPSLCSISIHEHWMVWKADERPGGERVRSYSERWSDFRKIEGVWTCKGQALPIADIVESAALEGMN